MNRSSTIGRLAPVVAAVIALGAAGGAAVVAGGASGDPAGIVSQAAARPSAPSVGDCASMSAVATDVAGATSASGSAAGVHAARGKAAAVAKVTVSDDVREVAQNLADDLAALQVALTTSGDTGQASSRRADIRVMIRDDLAALRHLCGR